MNALDVGLAAVLEADTGAGGIATLVGVDQNSLKKIYQLDAPQKVTPPYVLWQEVHDLPGYAFGNTLKFDHAFYMLRAFAVDANTSGPSQVSVIADRLKTLLTNPSLSVSGKVVLSARFDRSYPPLKERDNANSRYVYSRGILCEVWVANTPITTIFNSSGSWVAPSNVSNPITVECWGAGADGASHTTFGNGGSGGGGGAYARSVISVTPDTSYVITVDTHVLVGPTGDPNSGSSFGSSVVFAESGYPGADNSAVPANGGLAANCIGDLVRAGGHGGVGLLVDVVGGGGGGAGGPNGTGLNAASYIGGNSTNVGGGNGGNGEGPGLVSPTAGTAPGGGGGGDNGQFSGKFGASGRVKITYELRN